MGSQFTEMAQEALTHASKIAGRLKQGYAGTEHILAGLLREQTGVAHKVLADNHVELQQVLDMIQELIAFDGGVGLKERGGYSPRARKILEEDYLCRFKNLPFEKELFTLEELMNGPFTSLPREEWEALDKRLRSVVS